MKFMGVFVVVVVVVAVFNTVMHGLSGWSGGNRTIGVRREVHGSFVVVAVFDTVMHYLSGWSGGN